MAKFGEQLRKFRQQCNDAESPHGKLTQEKLGDLIGGELGIRYSGAAVSDWERGESKIHADDRRVLAALIKVLHDYGGLETVEQAGQLLEAGNYRALNLDETKAIFRESLTVSPVQSELAGPVVSRAGHPSPEGGFFLDFLQEIRAVLAKANEGPPPAWPRVMAAVFRRFSDRLSASIVWIFILRVWVRLFAWWLIAPSLRWPFPSQDEAVLAMVTYTFGTIIIPALIGGLTNTRDNESWKLQELVKQSNLRLYTHQGAGIGFHLGYFFVFMLNLLRYNLNLHFATWLELIVLTLPIILAFAGARLIPYNLWLTYHRLNLRDGAIFFTFFLLGPAWGYFFLESYDILLTRALGVFVFLLAITIVVGQTAWRNRRKDKTIGYENGHENG